MSTRDCGSQNYIRTIEIKVKHYLKMNNKKKKCEKIKGDSAPIVKSEINILLFLFRQKYKIYYRKKTNKLKHKKKNREKKKRTEISWEMR